MQLLSLRQQKIIELRAAMDQIPRLNKKLGDFDCPPRIYRLRRRAMDKVMGRIDVLFAAIHKIERRLLDAHGVAFYTRNRGVFLIKK